MRLLQIIRETIVYRRIFKKIKSLDSKYFATLCDNWKEIKKGRRPKMNEKNDGRDQTRN